MRFAVALALVALLSGSAFVAAAAPDSPGMQGKVRMDGSLSPKAMEARDLGAAPGDFPVSITIGLDLRNKAELDRVIAAASDPASPSFHHWLTQEQFNQRFGPLPAHEARVVQWLADAGFHVRRTFPNHLLVVADGTNDAVQRAFGVQVHRVQARGEARFAALDEPWFPADIASFTTGVTGLDDLAAMHPASKVGASCCHLAPPDLVNLYTETSGYDGTGQTVVIAGAYAWKDTDNADFATQWGLPNLPAGSGQVCTGPAPAPACAFDATQSQEISLDVDYVHGTAPGAVVLNYMAKNTSFAAFQVMYNQVVTDNPGHTVSTSWGACEPNVSVATQTANDNIFANGNAIGQSWFAASGDDGSRDCNTAAIVVDHPANSPHIIGVGGTTPTCSSGMTNAVPLCGGYGSETAWAGSGGGASNVFGKPTWQQGCNVPNDGKRDVPDVSIEANPSPGNFVRHNGNWIVLGGTSDGAPQWAGLYAMLNQKDGGNGLGMPGLRIYQLCGSLGLHDVTTGSNGDFNAGAGYDQVTGVGTPDMGEFVDAYFPVWEWYLNDEAHSTQAGFHILSQFAPLDNAGTVTVPSGSCALFASEKPAAAAFTVPKDGTNGLLAADHGNAFYGIQYASDLGSASGGVATLPVSGDTIFHDEGVRDAGVLTAADPAAGGSFTVATGAYLAFQACNTGDKDLVLHTDGASGFNLPRGTDPFPLPELPLVALSALGLLGVALAARRR